MSETRHVRLPDGRTLALAEYGDRDGSALFYFHGYPGCRLEARLADAAARSRGIRLIALDRPGFGRSDPARGRRLSDWPADVAATADALELERFAVAGVSGGGPFALACAARLPDRVTSTGVIGCLGPPASRRSDDGMMWHNRLGLTLSARVPWLARPVFGAVGPVLPRLHRVAIGNLERHVDDCDRAVLRDPAVRATLTTMFREGLARGGAGMADDARIFGADWDVELDAIRGPVSLWHGELDRVVPISMGRWVADAVPGCRATWFPDEGHFSIVVRRIDEIFGSLSDGCPARPGP